MPPARPSTSRESKHGQRRMVAVVGSASSVSIAPCRRSPEHVPQEIPDQVFYNDTAPRVQPPLFQRVPVYGPPPSSSEGAAASNASTHRLSHEAGLPRVVLKSSVVVLSVAFLVLLGVACVIIANRTSSMSKFLQKNATMAVQPTTARSTVLGSRMAQRATEAAENVAAKAETTSKASANNLLVEKPHGMLGAAYIQKTVAPRGFSRDYVCTTDSCIKEGERLAGLVDPVLSPCDNFYEYTCATWAEEHPVPRGAQKVSYRSSLVDYVEKKLDDMVRAELRKVLSMPLAFNFLSSHVKAILMRNACMEVERLEDRGLGPLREVLQSLHLAEWPTVKIDFNESLIERVAGALGSRLGVFPLSSVDVDRDPDNPAQFVITLDEPSREVFRRGYFLHSERELLEYEAVTRKAFDKLSNPALSDLLGSAVLGLEDEISQAMGSPVQLEEKVRRYVKMSVADLPRCSKFQWLRFLNHTMEKVRPVHRGQVVVVRNVGFVQKLAEILEGRQRRTIVNYLGLKALLVFSPLLAPSSEGGMAALRGSLLTGGREQLPRWRLCLRAAEDAMPFAFLGMYHDAFVREHNVLQLRAALGKVKDLLAASLEDVVWLASKDAPRALEKLKRLDFVEFFPAWVMSEEERNVFYESVRDVPVGNLLRSLMSAKSAHVDQRFRRLLFSPAQGTWFGSVFDVHVTYDPQNNTLYIPMAMFAEPMGFDNAETPLYIPRVLAGLAQRLMASVTGLGSLFDAQSGALRDWWGPETRDAYANYSRCLAHQYNASLSGLFANAQYSSLTAESNVRDNAALAFLRNMYAGHLKERGIKGNFVLANLPNVTAEQLFYTAYAMGFCENSNEGHAQRHVRTSTVALTQHRVNIPLANSDGFGDAFRCVRGTPMNPHVKCKFWRFQ
ncbi:neprilysin-1-like [Amblyomma americanum]